MVLRLVSMLMFLCVLAGCASPSDVPKTMAAQPGDGQALVAIGLIMPETTYSFSFDRFDSATKTLLPGATEVKSGLEFFRTVADMRYHVTAIPPGHYVIGGFSYKRAYITHNMALKLGTLEFTVEPGVVNYVGDIAFDSDTGLKFLGRNQDGLAAFMSAQLPNVKLPIKPVPSQPTTFTVP